MATNGSQNIATAAAGKVLQGAGVGSAPTYSTPTYPSASGTSRKILVSDGTNNVYSTETWAVPGTSGNVLTSDGTNWTSAAASGGGAGGIATIVLYEDFIGTDDSLNAAAVPILTGAYTWNLANASTFLVTSNNATNGHPGTVASTGANAVIFMGCASGVASGEIILGGGAITFTWIFKINNLSAGAGAYYLVAGLGDKSTPDTSNSGRLSNGVYIRYNDTTNSAKWVFACRNGGTETTNNTTIAVTTGWHNLTVTINAAGTSITGTIDGSSLGAALTTNIPTGVLTPEFGYGSGGSPAGGALIADMFYLTQTLTTTR